MNQGFFDGAEGGIRTLETLLTFTRFPIVRARPTTRLLHMFAIAQLAYYNADSNQSQV